MSNTSFRPFAYLTRKGPEAALESATIQYILSGPHIIIACPRQDYRPEEEESCLLPSTTQDTCPTIVLWIEEDSTPLITGEVLQQSIPVGIFYNPDHRRGTTTKYSCENFLHPSIARTTSHFCEETNHISVEELNHIPGGISAKKEKFAHPRSHN